MIVADPDDPALRGRRSRHREVAAQADDGAGAGGGVDGGRGPIGAQRLGGGAQVQLYARGNLHGGRRPVHPDVLPARHGLQVDPDLRPARGDGGEVPVVPDHVQGLAHRRVDQPAGDPGGPERHLDRFQQEGGDVDRAAARLVEPRKLAVGPEAAGCGVDGRQLSGQDGLRRLAHGRVAEHQHRGGPQGGKGDGEGRAHDPPDDTTGVLPVADCGDCAGVVSEEEGVVVVEVDPVEGLVLVPADDAPEVDRATVPVVRAWDAWPGRALATARDRAPPATSEPAARKRVLTRTRWSPRSRLVREGMNTSDRRRS